MPKVLGSEKKHQIEAYLIDFRKFKIATKKISDIVSDSIDTQIISAVLGERRIK
jgi:hypothetical protein